MLEQMRRNSRSFIIWILFGTIIAVFIFSFGPQAGPDSFSCSKQAVSDSALEVSGEKVPLTSWRFAMSLMRGGGAGQAAIRRQQAMDSLVERELLAQAAEGQGFLVDDDAVNLAMSTGEFLVLGQIVRQDDPTFLSDYKQLEQFASQLGLGNVRQLIDEQRRERTADMMRQLLLRSATVSDEEARQVYVNQNTRITADYVKFDTRRYRSALQQLSEADIERYVSGNEAELKKAWEAEKAQWASDKPRVLARVIFVGKDRPTKPGQAAVADKVPARKRIDEARARLTGGADFAAVAREVSEDRASKARGGLLGWRPAESLGQGKEVVEAVKSLEVGKISDVVEGERGFYVIRVEERSEKALSYEQKRVDLAARAAPEFYAKALAKRDADKAIAMAASQPLDQLFQRKANAPGGMNGELPQDLPPEVLEQLEQLKSQGIDVKTVPPDGLTTPDAEGGEAPAPEGGAPAAAPGDEADGKTGALWIREGENVLAQSGGAPAPAPAAPAGKPAAPAAGSPAGKPAAGSPAKPAAGSPAKPAAPGAAPGKPTGKPGAAGAAPTAGADGLPDVTIEKPSLDTVGPVARMGDFLPGVGKSEKLVTDLFEKAEVGKVAPEAYELPDGYAVVLLKEREKADVTKFAEARAELLEQLAYQKGLERLSAWVTRRCEDVSKSGEIKVSRDLFSDGDQKTEGAPDYQPCATLGRYGRRGF